MSWEELIERVNEMRHVEPEDIMNNPAEVNSLIDGWNSLMEKNEPELRTKQGTVYYILCAARKIALMDTSNQILEIKKYYIK